MTKRILVVGANGFIGSCVYDYLSRFNGVLVHSIADFFPNHFRLGMKKSYLDYWPSTYKFDAVVNCAASISDDPDQLLESNFHLVNELIDICNYFKPSKLIHISRSFISNSEKMYPTRLNSLYEYSKKYAEYAIESLCTIPFSLIRITAPIGPSMPKNRFLSQILISIKSGLPVKIYGEGKRVQNYVFASDIAKTIYDLVQTDILPKVCWVVGRENISDLELVLKIYSELDIMPSYIFSDFPSGIEPDENDYSFYRNYFQNDYVSPYMSLINQPYLKQHLLCL